MPQLSLRPSVGEPRASQTLPPARPRPSRARRPGRRAGHAHRARALPGRPHAALSHGRPVALPPRQRAGGRGRGLAARDGHRGLEPDDRAERLERRRRHARVDEGLGRLVPQGLPPAVVGRPLRLDPSLRVGQLPHARVGERHAGGDQPRRLPAVRAAHPRPRAEPRRRQPAGGARRQRAAQLRPAARRPQPHGRPHRRLVELRRAAARGLPAPGRPRRDRDRPGAARAVLPHVRGERHRPRHRPQHLRPDADRRRQRAFRQPAVRPRPRPRRPRRPVPVRRRAARRLAAAVVARAPVALQRVVLGLGRWQGRGRLPAAQRHPPDQGRPRQAHAQRAAGEHPRHRHARGRPQRRLRPRQRDAREHLQGRQGPRLRR